jgi:pimeloyl-ACP methyl ester carboxylesterase
VRYRSCTTVLVSVTFVSIALRSFAGGTPQFLQSFPLSELDHQTEWTPCSWDIEQDDGLAECARVSVPLDYSKSSAVRFIVFVKRRHFAGSPSAQVWLVQGGPGASATQSMEKMSYQIYKDRPNVQFYAVDHRGTGGSGVLSCPSSAKFNHLIGRTGSESVDVWRKCASELRISRAHDLAYLTPSNSARDLASLIAKYRIANAPVFVYGGSYGTYVALRYLQMYPSQPDGVIIEGITTNLFMQGYDAAMNIANRDLFGKCAEVTACARHFHGDPWAAAASAIRSLDRGHCPDVELDAASARSILGVMAFYARYRNLIPAIIHRIERCNPDDIKVLRHTKQSFSEAATLPAWFSAELGLHVSLSELYREGRGRPHAEIESLTMTSGEEAGVAAIARAGFWPVYPTDRYFLRWPHYSGPLLMLQGALDAATPVRRAREVRDHFTGEYQTWAEFPEGAHGVTNVTPTKDGGDCAKSIYEQFLDNPRARLDLACVALVEPINWDGTPEYANSILGTTDVWGDGN